jgi:hypothetical protein
MSNPIYNIVFFGIIAPGKDKAVVIDNMARLFRTTPEKVTPYFAGGRKVIKAGVDELTAEKYRVALENIGLVIKLEVAESVSTQENSSPAKAVAIDTGGITLAEPGADVVEHPVVIEPQPIGDISGLTTAEPGADVLEHPVVVEPRSIGDISGITLAEVGADVLEHPVESQTRPIGDISGITLAEVGADIIEHPGPKEKAPIPDTSGLSLADS